MGILLYTVFRGQVEIKIYLYEQRHDIYGESIDNISGEGHIDTYMRAGSLYKAIKYSKTYNIK